MSFPFDSAARLVSAFRSLNEPVVSLPSIAPVALLADYSRRSSSEGIECRGLVGGLISFAAGRTPFVQVSAPSRPVIVDSVRIRQGDLSAVLGVTISPAHLVAPAAGSAIQDIGGVAHTAWVQSGTVAGPLAGTTDLPITDGIFDWPSGSLLRLYVPRGVHLTLTTNVSVQWEWMLLLREIVE